MTPLDVECPRCHRKPGFGCVTNSITGQWATKTHAARLKAVPLSRTPKWDAMSPAQQRHCQFMGFDPDNPDVPLD